MRTSPKTVLGLDIGTHAIKIVQATVNGQKLRVLRAEEIPLPLDLSEIGSSLRRWLDKEQLSHCPVVTQVGGSRVLYQHLQMEAEDPREFEQVARMEALRFSEMTDAQMEVSVSPASLLKQERNLLLCMARPDLLQLALAPPLQSGVNLINACPAPVALYNGFIGLGEPIHQSTLFADLGASHTEIIIADGQGVRFARSFALGTSQLTQGYAARAGLTLAQAERNRLKAQRTEDLSPEMEALLSDFTNQWTRELQACLQLYSESKGKRLAHDPIRRVMLSGGGSGWQPLVQRLKETLDLSLSTPASLPGLEGQDSRSYIIACGLAADGLGVARAPSSLLTPQIRQSLNRKRNKQYWMATCVFSVGALAMFGAATQLSFQREKKELDRHNATLQRSDAIRKDSEAMLQKKAQVDKMVAPLTDFVSNSTRIRDLTLFIATAKDPDDFLTFLGDSESYLQIRLEDQDDKERRSLSASRRLALKQLNRKQADEMRDASMTRIIIEGFTKRRDLSTVKKLIEQLESLPMVERADLLSDDLIFEDSESDRMWATTRARRFVLDLRMVDLSLPQPKDAS